ncbi:hypothetical protein F5146DRAFT_1224517 [Armillaria mellea]|nr:hypothetical protein F5146DRAFT_1224517 [Armillaria mellea]
MITETILLLAFRGALFFGCRRYILRILYEDLQELSSTSGKAETIELSLPTSSTSIVQNGQKMVTREERHTSISHSTFALCFTESCTLFLLLMFQGLDIFTPGIRVLHFRTCLLLLLLIILLVVPLLFSYIIISRPLLSFVPPLICLFLLSFIPLPSPLDSNPDIDLMTACLSRLIVVGTIILGALSGFGAVRSCWLYLFAKERPVPTDRDIEVSTAALARIREDLKARMDEATRKDNNGTVPWYSRVVKTFGSDDISQEIAGLEALEYQMALALDDKRERQRAHCRSRTLYGRAWNLGGKVFAVYCVIRILSSIINLAFPTLRRTSSSSSSEYNYPDLVAYLVSLLLPLFTGTSCSTSDWYYEVLRGTHNCAAGPESHIPEPRRFAHDAPSGTTHRHIPPLDDRPAADVVSSPRLHTLRLRMTIKYPDGKPYELILIDTRRPSFWGFIRRFVPSGCSG